MKSSMTEVDSLDCAGTQVVCLLVVTEQNRLSEGDATICTVRNNIKKTNEIYEINRNSAMRAVLTMITVLSV